MHPKPVASCRSRCSTAASAASWQSANYSSVSVTLATSCCTHMSYSLNSLKGLYRAWYRGQLHAGDITAWGKLGVQTIAHIMTKDSCRGFHAKGSLVPSEGLTCGLPSVWGLGPQAQKSRHADTVQQLRPEGCKEASVIDIPVITFLTVITFG